MSEKFATSDVFDFKIYDADNNVIYATETVTKNVIEGGGVYKNKLLIEDALFDVDFAENVFNGEYRNIPVRVEGYTRVRRLDGSDHKMLLEIKQAKIVGYQTKNKTREHTHHELILEFPRIALDIDEKNLTYKLAGEWW